MKRSTKDISCPYANALRTAVLLTCLLLAVCFAWPCAQAESTPAGSSVYMTKDISPAGLMAIYKALDREATGKVAIKVHMGEPTGKNFL